MRLKERGKFCEGRRYKHYCHHDEGTVDVLAPESHGLETNMLMDLLHCTQMDSRVK